VTSGATRQAALAMDAVTFRELGHRLVDRIASFLESLPHGPVTREQSPSSVRDALGLGGALPEAGMDPELPLEQTAQLLFEHSLFNAHPRFNTARGDVDALLEIVTRAGRIVDVELRSTPEGFVVAPTDGRSRNP
jgi:hypothetical protein